MADLPLPWPPRPRYLPIPLPFPLTLVWKVSYYFIVYEVSSTLLRRLIYFVVVVNWFLWQHLSPAWLLILLTASFVSVVVDSFDSVFFACVLFRFQRWLLSIGIELVLLVSIPFSRRQSICLSVKYVLLLSNVLSSSSVPLFWLVNSCWVYHGVQTIYRSIWCYLFSAICATTLFVVNFRCLLSENEIYKIILDILSYINIYNS